MEDFGTIVGQASNTSYLLEGQLQASDLMIAKAVVTPDDSIPVRVMNPTSQPVILYKGTKMALLLGIDKVICCQQSLPVSSMHQHCDNPHTVSEEVFQSLMGNTSLTRIYCFHC